MFGTEIIIIDPEGEYAELSNSLGGEVVEFTPSSPIKINPFDLSGLYEEGENELGLKNPILARAFKNSRWGTRRRTGRNFRQSPCRNL